MDGKEDKEWEVGHLDSDVLALQAKAARAVQAAFDRQGLHTSALEPYTGQEVF